LSHTLERTIGYYMAMMIGATVAFNRSVKELPDDLLAIKPTILISVPRIYERVYGRILEKVQTQSPLKRALFALTQYVGWQRFRRLQRQIVWHPALLLWPLLNRLVASKIMQRLGGRMKIAVCGGAPLAADIGRFFISMGLMLLQGYGLTEASPVVSVNRCRRNRPTSIGLPLPGIEVRIAADGELQTRSPCVMRGYWNNEKATREAFTDDGWLRSGDKARRDEEGFIYITGRLKEIIVLSTGEKVPPADMEMAIAMDPLFEQVMIIGEDKPFLAALAVLKPEALKSLGISDDPAALQSKQLRAQVLEHIAARLQQFPGYAQVHAVHILLEPWTVENGLLTPTLKLKRPKLLERFAKEIDALYQNGKGNGRR
jgi:long-chain acyl-CoA synthetase